MFFVQEIFENIWANRKTLFLKQKMFLNLFGNIFASWEAKFVSETMFPEVGKQGNIDKKHNVSATMFPSLPRALLYYVIISK